MYPPNGPLPLGRFFMTKSFKIVTLGCKVNQYESAYIEESLIKAGWRPIAGDGRADISIINTCIVTKRASYQSRQAIRKALRENPSGKTAAIGCYAQVFPDELSQISGLDIIAGNTIKAQLPDILLNSIDSERPCLVSEDFRSDMPFQLLPIKGFSNRTRVFLKIQDGCQSFCSYCIVPLARGHLRSLEPQKVISMLKTLSIEGYREVVLTGIHLGRYGVDLNHDVDLKGLIDLIGKEEFPIRIRLSSLEPNEIDEELIDRMASMKWLCRHFHIPLQSGDDGILKKMNRDYTAGEFARLIEGIHQRIPLAAVGVDIMAGFPGEDTRAYQNSYSLIDDLPVSYLHVFPFSPREGTPAADFENKVNEKVIKDRARELRDLGKKKRQAFYQSCLGKDFLVLAEGWQSEEKKMIKGLSDNYLNVIFPSSLLIKNRMVSIRIEDLAHNGVFGIPSSRDRREII